jgi:hypothetical protein
MRPDQHHHRRENRRSLGSLRDGCNSRRASGRTANSSGVFSSAASPSIPTGIDELSVAIVCCVVGHAATTARPLMSRPVPRTSRAGSGRCAPGSPTTYTHSMPSSRRGRSAGPGAAPGEYALLDTRTTKTCSGVTTRGGTEMHSDALRPPQRTARLTYRAATRMRCRRYSGSRTIAA